MKSLILLAAPLLLAACNREVEEPDPVPPPTAATANRLMNEAEQAAGNASTRMNAVDATNMSEERP